MSEATIQARLEVIEARLDAMTFHDPPQTCCDIQSLEVPYACTRTIDHAGQHVAASDGWIYAEWPLAQAPVQPHGQEE